MPWKNQGGGGNWQGGNGSGPWDRGPRGGGGGNGGGRGSGGGGGGGQQPDLEELLRRGQDRFKNAFPPGGKGGGLGPVVPAILALVLIGGYLLSGFYTVEPDEQGVVTRFGKFAGITRPGLNYHLPWPVESVVTPKVLQQRSVDVGFMQLGAGRRNDVPSESLMLTGDENIVDVDFTVFWLINSESAEDFLFNVQNPEATVKAVGESTMREVVGRTNLEDILTQSRAQVQQEVKELMQGTLDKYGAGVTVTEIQLQTVDPPSAVIEAFRDVQAARQDLERLRNEAEAYANQIIPEARGRSEQIRQQSEAYKQRVVAEAQGEAARFISIYDEYRLAPDVTRRRIFLETMESVMADMNKVIIDGDNGGPGVLPYLPLQELRNRPTGSSQSRSNTQSNGQLGNQTTNQLGQGGQR